MDSIGTRSGVFHEELPHVPATDIDDILSRKLFLKSNQYIKNYEQGLKEHRERGISIQKKTPSSKELGVTDDHDDPIDDNDLFDPLK